MSSPESEEQCRTSKLVKKRARNSESDKDIGLFYPFHLFLCTHTSSKIVVYVYAAVNVQVEISGGGL